VAAYVTRRDAARFAGLSANPGAPRR
jgi:hypothetical protein